jgi:hypothetical protein
MIEVQITEATALCARVRASLPRGKFSAAAVVKGFIYGPKSQLAETVPVRHPLVDLSTTETLAGEAVLPEPCYATDELAMYYELQFEIRDREQIFRRTIPVELRPAQSPRLL